MLLIRVNAFDKFVADHSPPLFSCQRKGGSAYDKIHAVRAADFTFSGLNRLVIITDESILTTFGQ